MLGHIQLILTRLAMIFLQCLQGNRPDPARIHSLPSRREASSAVCGRRRWRPWPKRQDMWRKLRQLRSCFVGIWDGFGRFSDQKPWWNLVKVIYAQTLGSMGVHNKIGWFHTQHDQHLWVTGLLSKCRHTGLCPYPGFYFWTGIEDIQAHDLLSPKVQHFSPT